MLTVDQSSREISFTLLNSVKDIWPFEKPLSSNTYFLKIEYNKRVREKVKKKTMHLLQMRYLNKLSVFETYFIKKCNMFFSIILRLHTAGDFYLLSFETDIYFNYIQY